MQYATLPFPPSLLHVFNLQLLTKKEEKDNYTTSEQDRKRNIA